MAAQHQDQTRFTFELPVSEHKKLKAIAALDGISLKELIIVCLREHVLKDNLPNEETIKTFKETDEGKNIIRYKNAKDMINTLGLK